MKKQFYVRKLRLIITRDSKAIWYDWLITETKRQHPTTPRGATYSSRDHSL